MAETAVQPEATPAVTASNDAHLPVPHRAGDSAPAIPAGGRTITEGAAQVLYADPECVFYNRVQVFNRA